MDETLGETQEVQEVQEIDNKDINVNEWGKLLPFVSNYPTVALTNNVYTVGRSGDISLTSFCPYFNSISKVHFEIRREEDVVTLYDRSQNGTFVNGERLGKNHSKVLQTNDEIALSCKVNTAFYFIYKNSKDQIYPAEVTGKYTISKRLGGGACGEVKLAFNNETRQKVAVKVIEMKKIPLNKGGGGKTTNIETEVKILKQLNHPCMIQFHEAIETKDKLYIFMELVEGGELFDRVISVKQFTEKEAKVIFYQLVLAIQYLHQNNVSHRDLKPENILLCSTSSNITLIKVTDFGLSKFLDGKTMLKTLCGTPNYLAPEVILGRGETEYTFACDVWSLGVILFICVAGYPPFTDERVDFALRDQIIGGKFDFPPVHWAGISNQVMNLIKRMLIVDPVKRISIKDILRHAWLQDPEMRATVKKLMYPLADVVASCTVVDDKSTKYDSTMIIENTDCAPPAKRRK